MSLQLELQKVAEARHDITGHSGGTATEFHRVPLTKQSNKRDKDKRQGASLSIADMISAAKLWVRRGLSRLWIYLGTTGRISVIVITLH